MNKKRSRSERGSRKMRQNLSKTKRRQSSNKKGALKGIRNNKTKANKLRRIVQRGGGNRHELNLRITSNDVVQVSNYIRHAFYPSLYEQFINNSTQPPGNSALYTACRSTNPNIDIVKTLLFFGFKPDTPNHNENGSYPQHGVVAAADEIIRLVLRHEETQKRLNVLKDILEELNRAGADMRLTNKFGYTAYTEYSTRFVAVAGNPPSPSIEDRFRAFDTALSIEITQLLHSPPGHPPGYGAPPPGYSAPPHVHRVTGEVSFYPEFYNKFQGEPNKLPGLQETSNYQTTVNRNSYFTYKGVSYYFSQHIEESLQTKRKQVTVQRDAIEGGHFVGHYVFVIDGQDNITFNFYILNNSSTPADGYVSFQVDPENWVQDAPLTLVKKQ